MEVRFDANNRKIPGANFLKYGNMPPGDHAHLRFCEIYISAYDGRRHLNMGCKMTAIINFMGTQGIFEALKCFVFELVAKNRIAGHFMAHAPG